MSISQALPRVVVLGAGVSGLSCALLLKEAGFLVSIITEAVPPNTTSNKAAAVWYPFIVQPPDRATRWAKETLDFFCRYLIDDPASGVYPTQVREIFHQPKANPWWMEATPTFRRLGQSQLPKGYCDGYVIDAVVMVTNVYLHYLVDQCRRRGIGIRIQRIDGFDEAFEGADIVVNCTGLDSRRLCTDPEIIPVRGQILRIPPNGFDFSLFEEEGPNSLAYIIPRVKDIVLGGTAQSNDWGIDVRPEDTAEILRRCSALYPCFQNPQILGVTVGLRPHRSSVRLEIENYEGRPVVHNYGHGGSGFTLSWGCAQEVATLVASLS